MITRLVRGSRAATRLRFALLCLALGHLEAFTHAQTNPPTVSVLPRNPSVSLGAKVTFRATASGSLPISYQWRFNDVALQDATNNMLILSNITVPLDGSYTVEVTNVDGAATS